MRPLEFDVLGLLMKGSRHYSDIVKLTGHSEKGVWQALESLEPKGLVKRKTRGLYEITVQGSEALKRAEAFSQLDHGADFLSASIGVLMDFLMKGNRDLSIEITALKEIGDAMVNVIKGVIAFLNRSHEMDLVEAEIIMRFKVLDSFPKHIDRISETIGSLFEVLEESKEEFRKYPALLHTVTSLANEAKFLLGRLELPPKLPEQNA